MRAPLIRRLTLQNFLSYGPEGVSVDLHPLNVLIGPNASGKSNLLEALAIFRATASDLQGTVREGGGVGEFVHKGEEPSAVLEASIDYPLPPHTNILRHEIEIARTVGGRLAVVNEMIQRDRFGSTTAEYVKRVYDWVRVPTLYTYLKDGSRNESTVPDLKQDQSILAQRRDPGRYPEVTFLAHTFAEIALFQEWNFGRRTSARLPQPTDLPSGFLLPDTSNLGLVLHDLGQTSAKREELMVYLRRFYEPARFISTKIQGGTIQLYIEEEGERLIPATRLSDGTLRYLCLLAILCHPNPPSVVAIEEPELGLHPDILPTIAELLRKASERTQLFVTTHSDALVSALSDTPESILVCEATPDGTTMKRLEAEPLREWLEKYSLGEIWRMGEIGGNRW